MSFVLFGRKKGTKKRRKKEEGAVTQLHSCSGF
jgi:hypothetical protein